MLIQINQVDTKTVERLFAIYAESMEDLKAGFGNLEEMKSAYASFLSEFISKPNQLVLVEVVQGVWVSDLRAIETGPGHWFLEAVETMPAQRRKGCGEMLLHHTVDYLQRIGMKDVSCTISKQNAASQALHGKCGFTATGEPPVNPWGELEDGTILFRFCRK